MHKRELLLKRLDEIAASIRRGLDLPEEQEHVILLPEGSAPKE